MSELVPCSDCGAQTDRDEMFGPPSDLRCPSCAEVNRKKLQTRVVAGRGRVHRPIVTMALIVCSVLATGALRVVPEEHLHWTLQWFPLLDGELWRHLTCTFLHGGFLHLLFNMWWLWDFGRSIEARWNAGGMLVLWAGLAVGSSSVQWLAGGPGIGMSGVVYGLWGLLFALRRTKDYAARASQPQVNQVFLGWFFLCVVLTATGMWNIGNWAHGGGAVLGFLLGKAIEHRQRRILVPAAYLLMAALAVATISVIPLWARG